MARPAPGEPQAGGLPQREEVAAWFRWGDPTGTRDEAVCGEPALREGCSVVVCTLSRAAALSRLIDSLKRQVCHADELLVVDASSDDGTERMLRARDDLQQAAPRGTYWRVAERWRGLTRQRNFALRRVRCNRAVFFDDDVVLAPECLRELNSALRDPQVVGAAAYINNLGGTPPRGWRWRRRLSIVSSLRPGAYCRSGFSVPWGFLEPGDGRRDGDWLPGGCTIWRTDLARRLQFNEWFAGYGQGEDLEFSLRMGRHGRLVLFPAARVDHLHETSGRPDNYRLGYMAIYNRYQIHRRALQNRTVRDVAWFAYAWSMDTLLLSFYVLSPHHSRSILLQIVGRARAAFDLLRGH